MFVLVTSLQRIKNRDGKVYTGEIKLGVVTVEKHVG